MGPVVFADAEVWNGTLRPFVPSSTAVGCDVPKLSAELERQRIVQLANTMFLKSTGPHDPNALG